MRVYSQGIIFCIFILGIAYTEANAYNITANNCVCNTECYNLKKESIYRFTSIPLNIRKDVIYEEKLYDNFWNGYCNVINKCLVFKKEKNYYSWSSWDICHS